MCHKEMLDVWTVIFLMNWEEKTLENVEKLAGKKRIHIAGAIHIVYRDSIKSRLLFFFFLFSIIFSKTVKNRTKYSSVQLYSSMWQTFQWSKFWEKLSFWEMRIQKRKSCNRKMHLYAELLKTLLEKRQNIYKISS